MPFATHSRYPYRAPDRAMLTAAASALALCIIGAISIFVSAFHESPPTAQASSSAPLSPMRSVLIPLRDIEPNTALDTALFRLESRPAQYTTQAALRSSEELKGRFSAARLPAGEPVLHAHLSTSRAASPLSPRIIGDSRAITIHVTEVGSVDGMVRPGDIVDVAWLYRHRGQPALKIIVQNARVLGADRQVDGSWKPGLPAPGTITLLVSPPEARHIQLASQNGTLSLALRGPEAQLDPDAEEPLTLSDVMGEREVVKAAPNDCRGTLRMSGQTWCVLPDGSLRARGDYL